MNMNIFQRNTRSGVPDSEAFAKAQDDCQKLALTTIPAKFKEIQRERNNIHSLLEQKSQLEEQYADEFNENGLRPEYLNQRSNRRRVILGATILESMATAFTLHLMFGIQIPLALAAGLIIALIVFFAASADKVAGKELPARWTWIVLIAYNLFLAVVGVILGSMAGADPIYLIIHVIISTISFLFIRTALKYAEEFSRDRMISKVKKHYDKIMENIKKLQLKLNKLENDFKKLLESINRRAIDCFNQFLLHGRDESNLRFVTQTRLVLNQVFHEDVFPISQTQRQLTTPDPNTLWNDILTEFGHVQNHNAPQITGNVSGSTQNNNAFRSGGNSQTENQNNVNQIVHEQGNSRANQDRNNQNPEINNIPDEETEL